MNKKVKTLLLFVFIIMIIYAIFLSSKNTANDEKETKEKIILCTGTFISKEEGKPKIIVNDDKKNNYEMIYSDEKNNVKGIAVVVDDKIEVTYNIKEVNPETNEEYETDYTTKYYQDKKCDYIKFEGIKYYKEK